jgi:hypothetical protein
MQTTATTSKRSSRSPDSDADDRLARAEFDAFRRQRFDATDANGTVDVEEYMQEFEDRVRQQLEQGRGGEIEATHPADQPGALIASCAANARRYAGLASPRAT